LRVEGNKIYREKGSKKVKKNGEKCQYFFFHEKAKLESAAMVRASRKKLARIISAMASDAEILGKHLTKV
jgi:hypothetical protein